MRKIGAQLELWSRVDSGIEWNSQPLGGGSFERPESIALNLSDMVRAGTDWSRTTMTRKITVICVDDHPVLRMGIAAIIAGEQDIELVAEAASAQDAIELFRIHRPDVTLMDLQMPGMNGIEAMLEIREEFPQARFIVLTTYQGDAQALRALKAGASGYLLKSMLRKELMNAIRTVHAGRRCIPPEIAAELAEHVTDDALSDRETEVLRRVAMGTPNKIIAVHLNVSEATVKGHMKSILSKLGANDRTHAVTIAMKRGFIDG
jgi:DNA-binding NarL/FixJ family response regulator